MNNQWKIFGSQCQQPMQKWHETLGVQRNPVIRPYFEMQLAYLKYSEDKNNRLS